MDFFVFLAIFSFVLLGFFIGLRRARKLSGLLSSPFYYGAWVSLLILISILGVLILWFIFSFWLFEKSLIVLVILASVISLLIGVRYIVEGFNSRHYVEKIVLFFLFSCALTAILVTVGIVLSLFVESLAFFREVSVWNFFSSVWDPRFQEAGSDLDHGSFGFLPLFWGTLYISCIAILVAFPLGLLSAIYLCHYSSDRFRRVVKPLLEILAGIPTVVYGFFALMIVGPLFSDMGSLLGLEISPVSVLTAGVVMGIMLIPFISSLSDDVISAVPRIMWEGSLALGATYSESIRKIVLPSALPGLVGAITLALSRAIGETMIVVMAAGIAAKMSLNPFQAMTTMTVKIVSQLTGDLEFTSPQTTVAFALALTLFIITMFMNLIAVNMVKKYRERYE